MKKTLILLTLITTQTACSESSEVCECFENRLAIKKQLKEAKGDLDKMKLITDSDSYLEKQKTKEECKKIEQEYFSKFADKYTKEKDLLENTMSDCQAVQDLMKGNY